MVKFKLKVGMMYDKKHHEAGSIIAISELEAKLFHYAGEIVKEEVKSDGKKTERGTNSKRKKQKATGSE